MIKSIFTIYGLLLIVGGFIGYKKAGSKPSLIMGLLSGLIILCGVSFIATNTTQGFAVILAMSALLVVTFTIRLIKTKKVMPAGMLLLLSLMACILSWLQI